MKFLRLFVLAAAGLTSCRDSTGTTDHGESVASVVLSRSQDTIRALGYTRQIAVTVRDGRGAVVAPATAGLTWSSSDASIASVNETGLVTAQAPGEARIHAAASTAADTILITVRQIVASLQVAPVARSVLVGDTMTFGALARDSNAVEVPKTSVEWAVADTGVASIAPASGLASGRRTGVTAVTASHASLIASALLTVQNLELVKTVFAPPRPDDPSLGSVPSGYWMGAAPLNLSRVAITPYLNFWGNSPLLTYLTPDGDIVATYDVVGATTLFTHPTRGGAGAADMTPDGARTVIGSDDGHLYVYAGTLPYAAGMPTSINGFIRAVGISPDGHYAAAAAKNILTNRAIFTLHDLSAPNPISPIHYDTTTVLAVAFSADNRYAAYCGSVIMVFDLERRERVFRDSTSCSSIDISPDGSRILAATGGLSLYVRTAAGGSWALAQRIITPGNLLDLSADGRFVAYGGGSTAHLSYNSVSLYQVGDSSLTLSWTQPWNDATAGSLAKRGQITTISLRADGNFVVVGTEGGPDQDGGQVYIYDRAGRLVFFHVTFGRQGGLSFGRWNQVTFARISSDGTRVVFANHGGVAYFFRLKSTQ